MHVQRHLISAVIGLAVEARDDDRATFREIRAGRRPETRADAKSERARVFRGRARDRLTGFVVDAELVLDRQLLRGFEVQDGDGRERLRSD